MLNCANEAFESLKRVWSNNMPEWETFKSTECCTAEETEQISGEPFSLFQQHCVYHITEHKKVSFRNWSIYLLLSERRLWCTWRFPDWRLCTAKSSVPPQSPGQRLDGMFLGEWMSHLQCVSCSDTSSMCFLSTWRPDPETCEITGSFSVNLSKLWVIFCLLSACLVVFPLACISVVSKAHLCKSIVTAKPYPWKEEDSCTNLPQKQYTMRLLQLYLPWPDVRQAA